MAISSEARFARCQHYIKFVSEGGLEPPDNPRKHWATGAFARHDGLVRGTSRYVAGLRRHRVGHVPPEFNLQRVVGNAGPDHSLTVTSTFRAIDATSSSLDDSMPSPGRMEAVDRTRASTGGEACGQDAHDGTNSGTLTK